MIKPAVASSQEKLTRLGSEWIMQSPRPAMRIGRIATVALTTLSVACQTEPRQPPVALTARTGTASPGTDTTVADDGQWVMPAKDYASTRFSGLNEINTGNVGRLH